MEIINHFKNMVNPKKQIHKASTVLLCVSLFCCNYAYSQTNIQLSDSSSQQTTQSQPQKKNLNRRIYLGPGVGLDYGGMVGAKIEYLPVKFFGIFGALGRSVLLSGGGSVGATLKILPNEQFSPNLMFLYGYQGAFTGLPGVEYNVLAIGGNLDIIIGRRGNKLSVGIFAPIESEKFTSYSDVMSTAISIGYNFVLK